MHLDLLHRLRNREHEACPDLERNADRDFQEFEATQKTPTLFLLLQLEVRWKM